MNKTLPRKITDIKGKVALAELWRTHYIITVLAFAFAFVLAMSMFEALEVDVILGTIAVVLLIILGLVSLGTALGLAKILRKK